MSNAGRIKVAWVGGGSYNWGPRLLRDILLTEGLDECEFRLLDVNKQAAREMAALGRRLCKDWGLGATFAPTTNQRKALEGADFVFITISTGGVEATAKDIRIPEAFGVYATVGDTVGPGGWARALRNFPVFQKLGEDIADVAPEAAVLNYSNPMSVLTRVLSAEVGERVVGLCHGLYENYATLQALFKVEEEDIKVTFGGLNHFFWMLDFTIKGEPGYPALERRLGRKSLAQAVRSVHKEREGVEFNRDKEMTSELYQTLDYLPYVGDRHICEFLSSYINGPEAGTTMDRYRLERTPPKQRRENARRAHGRLLRWIDGREEMPRTRSRETAADVLAACALGREFIDVINVPNRGQIANLPAGAVVETMGVINSIGFTPLAVGPLPEGIRDLVLPHAVNQERIVEACYLGDLDMAVESLANDPTTGHLSFTRVRKLADKLVKAHSNYLTQF